MGWSIMIVSGICILLLQDTENVNRQTANVKRERVREFQIFLATSDSPNIFAGCQ